MKITALDFGTAGKDADLDKTLGVVIETLKELGEITVDIIKADALELPFYNGSSVKSAAGAAKSVKSSDGVVLAFPVVFTSPNAMCAAFLEHMANGAYDSPFAGKNCMIAAVSKNGGERGALESVSSALGALGAYDAVRISVGSGRASGLPGDKALKDLIERQTEDYFRVLRQNRKYIAPQPGPRIAANPSEPFEKPLSEAGAEGFKRTAMELLNERIVSGEYFSDNENGDKDATDDLVSGKSDKPENAAPGEKSGHESHEKDIIELTRFFAEKYNKREAEKHESEVLAETAPAYVRVTPRAPEPRVKSVKQMTMSLPHYYQPQLAQGLNAVIQISVAGAETFECHLIISNSECDIKEGISPQTDMTIIAESKVWADILKGKHTAQKAFMVGQLKVRGNFALLTRFDQLFTLNMK